MSRGKIIGWSVTIIIIGSTAFAAWTLRQPLQQGLKLVTSNRQSEPAVRFAVIGDNHGINAVYRQAIKEIGELDVDFLVNLADTSEFGTRQEFIDVQTLEKTLPFPVYHTLGNHDIKTDHGTTFSNTFGHQKNYSISRGSLHLIILDNADRKIGFSQETLSWLESDLENNREKNIILAYHRPFDLPLAAVTGDDETVASRASNERLLEVIADDNIRFIMTGHIHTYLQYTVGDIPAVVSGGGGDPAQTILGGPAANYFHYLVVTVENGSITHDVHRIQL